MIKSSQRQMHWFTDISFSTGYRALWMEKVETDRGMTLWKLLRFFHEYNRPDIHLCLVYRAHLLYFRKIQSQVDSPAPVQRQTGLAQSLSLQRHRGFSKLELGKTMFDIRTVTDTDSKRVTFASRFFPTGPPPRDEWWVLPSPARAAPRHVNTRPSSSHLARGSKTFHSLRESAASCPRVTRFFSPFFTTFTATALQTQHMCVLFESVFFLYAW
jgi:hypothetical protein